MKARSIVKVGIVLAACATLVLFYDRRLSPVDDDEAAEIAEERLVKVLESLPDIHRDRLSPPEIQIQSDGTRLFIFDDHTQDTSIAIIVRPDGHSEVSMWKSDRED
jgi:hypothetical protein